jgi:hypothetical protein
LNCLTILNLHISGFDGCGDTPVEVLHVVLLGVVKYMTIDFLGSIKPKQVNQLLASWQSFNIDSLDLPPIKSGYMFKYRKGMIGKDFKMILQAAPFIFFQFMNTEQRNLWGALCRMSPYIFQTHIDNMEEFANEFEKAVQNFLFHLINSSARWINKPKFHTLIHLLLSILRFGPSSLFATEKFESSNSILRNASVHSNKKQPGRDIGNSFANYECLRAIGSGSYLYDHTKHQNFQASKQVTAIFQDKTVEKAMGYNSDIIQRSSYNYPYATEAKLCLEDKMTIPQELKQMYPNHEFYQEACLQLDEKKSVCKNYFVQMKSNNSIFIAQILSIWRVSSLRSTKYCLQINKFQLSPVSDFYQMRKIRRTNDFQVCSPKVRYNFCLHHN